MSATIVSPSGKVRTVKNLGWLLRHAAQVVQIRLTKVADTGQLWAMLNDRTVYSIVFASFSVMEKWVKRPSLAHVSILNTNCRPEGTS